MQRRRVSPASNRLGLGDALAPLARGASSFRQADAGDVGDVDPDLAALKSAWSWNFSGAPRTTEQEDKHWFQPQFSKATAPCARHRPSKLSCARCGQPLRIDELISHQAVCLGERDASSDEEASVTKPRWRGPLDKDPPKRTRRLRLPDLDPMDFSDHFSFFGESSASSSGDSFLGGARFPQHFSTWSNSEHFRSWSHGASRSAASTSASSRMGGDGGRSSSSSTSKEPPPRKPPSPPPRSVPPAAPVPAPPNTAALDSALVAHEGSWAKFDKSQAAGICYADVPWPDHSKSKADTILVQHALQKATEAGDVKAALRKLQLRWHPDKWAQRFAARLSSQDAERVLNRVKEIAQIVNGLKAST